MTDAAERLQVAIESQRSRLQADVPTDRTAATIGVVQAIDRRMELAGISLEPHPDLVSGRRFVRLGGSRAVRFCLEASDDGSDSPMAASGPALVRWADHFLNDCDDLAAAEMVLSHVERGFMRLAQGNDGRLTAWRATRLTPEAWRERANIDWWARWLARSDVDGVPRNDLRQRPEVDPLSTMAYQLAYPPHAVIDGCSVQTYCDVLRCLIAREIGNGTVSGTDVVQPEGALASSIATTLDLEPSVVARAVAAFIVDRKSAAWHATVPGVAAAPLVRVAPDRIVASRLGLMTEPLVFLGRELRRRAAPEYHNSAWLREVTFRDDLRRVFSDRRFVVSTTQVELRRGKGDIRTDIDAVVFDRKTGTLGLFELKSQDPFSRSSVEMIRRRDNVLYANRQVSGVLDWLNRNSADELLRRLDARAGKTSRVQKVFPFVLARHLVRFNDGAAPDRRAAWGTWPDVLRAVDASSTWATGSNPIASLFSRLRSDEDLIPVPAVPADARREIEIGGSRLIIFASVDGMRSASIE